MLATAGQATVARVFLGPLRGDLLLADAAATTFGSAAADDEPAYLAAAGDMDGDGLSDVLLSSFQASDRAGRVYLLPGPLAGPIDLSGATMLTGDGTEAAGMSLDTPGDVTGDGVADLVVGALYRGGTRGGAYIVAGPLATGKLTDQHAIFEGEAGSEAGGGVAGAGDVDGDGTADVLVGAQSGGSATKGRMYLLLGPIAAGTGSLADADAMWDGENDRDLLARSVDGAGDTDADGYADVLTGTLGSGGSAFNIGSAYLVRGGALVGHGGAGSASIGTADAIFRGENMGDNVGAVVSSAGDLDGDGFADVAIPVVGSDLVAFEAGAVAVFYGPVSAGSHDVSTADGTLTGETSLDYAGGAVAPAGDTDGDGAQDLLVAGFWSSTYTVNGGVVWLVRGGPR